MSADHHGSNLLHYVRYRLGLEPARTQTTPLEHELLRRLASRARTIVELGVFEGVSTHVLRSAMPPDARLFGIDPFPVNRWGFSFQYWITLRESARSSNGEFILLRTYSYEAAAGWTEPIDLLYMDAEQDFESLVRDYRDWSPHIRPGGHVLVHTSNVNPNKPVRPHGGPARLVREVIARDEAFELIEPVDSISVARRRAPVEAEARGEAS